MKTDKVIAENEGRLNDIDKRLDKLITVQEFYIKAQMKAERMQERTTRNIEQLGKDIREQQCSKSECEHLNERVKKVENTFYRLAWIVITPVIIAVVYLVVEGH